MRLSMIWLVLLLVAATNAASAQPLSCGPYAGCLYTPAWAYSIIHTTNVVTYTDVAGLPRNVPVAIRRPAGKPGPLPVVIWIHGGGEGQSDPVTAINEWSTATAEAGYLTITGAHELRSQPFREQLCLSIGVPGPECATFPPLVWDRPKDVSAMLDALDRWNANGPLQGQIDLERVAVGGHSAGSAAAMILAGARIVPFSGGAAVSLVDRRPSAFIGLSPQGPGHFGFFDSDFRRPEVSWDAVTRPVFTATGDGDARCEGDARDVCGDTPMLRRIAFDRMPAHDKFLMYLQDARSFHNVFALKTSECAEKNVSPGVCNAFAAWLKSGVLSFLDSYLLGRAPAQVWLRGPFLKTASLGITELERR